MASPPPDPGTAGTVEDLVARLRSLREWAGEPSYQIIKDRVNAAWIAAGRPASELVGRTTVLDCFRSGRRRLDSDLVLAVVEALHPNIGYVTQWRQALRVVAGETRAASQVRVHDAVPGDLPAFTGRTVELARLRQAIDDSGRTGAAVSISAIEGMAGVGKTQLAIRAAHLNADEAAFDRVLFVDLRGFHPDPSQPPADPGAVLDGFLRLLGVSGRQIPHDVEARTAAYRARLAGTRALVVLDNAAGADQVRPLLPETPSCVTLITSRRRLAGLDSVTHVTVDVFTPDEAAEFLVRAVPDVPVGEDPHAIDRIARACGYLPLALGLVAGHIRGTPGWTLTDHADRLDERHRDRRLDRGVELALDLSYQSLPVDQRRLVRLAALHPGPDLDAYAVAALADIDLATAQAHLHDLHRDYLLRAAGPDRYVFHDLVRYFAASRAGDEDRRAERRAALTRLFDYYLATAAMAMDVLVPAETHRRPRLDPVGSPMPALAQPDVARGWLDAERPSLVSAAAHAVAHGWPTHTIQLAAILYRYLAGGFYTDALAVHGHARTAAREVGDSSAEAQALLGLGAVHGQQGQIDLAADFFDQGLVIYRRIGDRLGEARLRTNLGVTDSRRGRYRSSADHYRQALVLYRELDDQLGVARVLTNLGVVEERLGRYDAAAEHHEQALVLYQKLEDLESEANALDCLGIVDERLGRLERSVERHEQALARYRELGTPAGEANALANLGHTTERLGRLGVAARHYRHAIALYQRLGNTAGEAWALTGLGVVHTSLGRPDQGLDKHSEALATFREIGDRDGEAWALNGLGEAAHAAGRSADAVAHHAAALEIAIDTGTRDQQARAHSGLRQARGSLGH